MIEIREDKRIIILLSLLRNIYIFSFYLFHLAGRMQKDARLLIRDAHMPMTRRELTMQDIGRVTPSPSHFI